MWHEDQQIARNGELNYTPHIPKLTTPVGIEPVTCLLRIYSNNELHGHSCQVPTMQPKKLPLFLWNQ